MELPQALKDSENAWLYTPIYKDVHEKHQHCPMVIVGKPGSGKSYLALYLAKLFYPDFDPVTGVVFNASDFAQKVSEKLPKGFAIVIDDAGLTAASTDAMTREVKAISKTMQSIRSRNLVIILTLPSFFLLAKNVRTLLEYYLEPVKINREKNICHAKFRILKVNPLSGEVYRYSPVIMKKQEHWTGYTQIKRVKIITLAFPKPDSLTCRIYENLKAAKMQEFNTKQAATLKYSTTEDKQRKIKEIAEFLKTPKAKKYVNVDNEFNLELMANDFLVNKVMIRDAFSIAGFEPIIKKGTRRTVFEYGEKQREEEDDPLLAEKLEKIKQGLKEIDAGSVVGALCKKSLK